MATIAEFFDLAVHYHQSGNLEKAETCYRQVLLAEPGHAAAHHLLGLVAHQTGRSTAAVALIRGAISLCPQVAVFHANLGIILKEQGDLATAALCYQEALRLEPGNADALCNLGIVLRDWGRVDEAVQCYQQALAVNPDHAQAHNNLGNALKDQGQFALAAQSFREALRINPRYARAHYNLGVLFKDIGDLSSAEPCFRQAAAGDTGHTDAHTNLGATLVYLGRYEEARQQYEHALRVRPGDGTALWNRALLRLLEGDFENGWPDYEARWTQPGFEARHLDRPRWNGSSLAGQTILLHAEQGLGDTIQFSRYVALVKQRGGSVVLECQPPLKRLLKTVAGADQVLAAGASLPPFDIQAPLLSLPGIFRTGTTTIPATVPYLHAETDLVEAWRAELAHFEGFRIGIAWQGSLTYKGDRYRSLPLRHFSALARVPGARLISLQKGVGSEQVLEIQSKELFPIVDLGEQLDRAGAFVDTAAVLMSLDLVVTSDTALAHVAGALGVPVWVVLPAVPDWRWLLERTDSPWYPTMRLFRQKQPGDWDEVLERCATEIRGLTQDH
jgi:Tfp pilus assembly protein PilF